MSPYQKKQKEKKRKNLFRKWHRRLGFSAAILLLNLSITGILLNHSETLGLDKRYIDSGWIVDWYGIKAPTTATCFSLAKLEKPICQIDEQIYYDNQQLLSSGSPLIAVTQLNHQLISLVTTHSISLFTPDLQLIESVTESQSLPVPITAAFNNTANDQLLFIADEQTWEFNDETLSFTETTTLLLKETTAQPAQGVNLKRLQGQYLSKQLTQLKFIQDLHSGRIFYLPGKLLTDLTAIITILLIISGFVAWQKRTGKSDY